MIQGTLHGDERVATAHTRTPEAKEPLGNPQGFRRFMALRQLHSGNSTLAPSSVEERDPAKVEGVGSSPTGPATAYSSVAEHPPDKRKVGGSIPSTRTIIPEKISGRSLARQARRWWFDSTLGDFCGGIRALASPRRCKRPASGLWGFNSLSPHHRQHGPNWKGSPKTTDERAPVTNWRLGGAT